MPKALNISGSCLAGLSDISKYLARQGQSDKRTNVQ